MTVKKLIGNNHTKIKLMIAIPRSNSTIIELVLASSPSIKNVLHEPFLQYGYYGKNISSAYKAISFHTKTTNKEIFLIKEMAHWITKKNTHIDFIKMIDPPVLLIIRNPILSIESKLKKILQGADRKNRHGLSKFLLPFIDKQKNKNIKDSRIALNLFALKYKYKTWKNLIEKEVFKKRNFLIFDPIIKYFIKSTPEDIWGLESILKIKEFLDKNKIEYRILDGTDFRLAPYQITYEICKIFNIKFDKEMIKLPRKKLKKIDFNQNQTHSIFWYKEFILHKKILKPNIYPIQIQKFPKIIQKYLLNKGLPIYFQLCKNSNRINIRKKQKNEKHK